MRDHKDARTAELPSLEVKRKRGGQPKPGGAKTDAERAKEYRARKKAEREARRNTSQKPVSKVLDLSTDLGQALAERKHDA